MTMKNLRTALLLTVICLLVLVSTVQAQEIPQTNAPEDAISATPEPPTTESEPPNATQEPLGETDADSTRDIEPTTGILYTAYG